MLLDLGRGPNDEEEEKEEAHVPLITLEQAAAQGFVARAYREHASEYYAQPLLLTEPTVALWSKVSAGAEVTRVLVTKAMDACRVYHVTVPPLALGEEDGNKPRHVAAGGGDCDTCHDNRT